MFAAIGNALSSVAAPLISGVTGLIGGQQANQQAWDISQASQAFSAEQAQKQMDFQKEMRETQYQTTVEDLKKAGLNPMLAYAQGGAGTPAGAAGTAFTAPVRNVLGEANSAFMAARQNEADVELKNTAATNTTAQTLKVEADTIKTAVDIQKTLEDTKISVQQQKNLEEQLRKLGEEILNLRATRDLTAATAKNVKENIAPSTDPFWYRDLKRGAQSVINSAKSAPRLLLPFGGFRK